MKKGRTLRPAPNVVMAFAGQAARRSAIIVSSLR